MGRTILVVDDDFVTRLMLKEYLEMNGCRIIEAGDGGEAFQTAQKEKPDLIITDINMPNLDGYGFIEGVRRDRRHRSRPILVLSTESDPEKKGRARAAGATGWIVKPFKAESLIDAIRRVAA